MHVISFEFLPSPDSISDTLESCEITRFGVRFSVTRRPRPASDRPAANWSLKWDGWNLALSRSKEDCL